MKGKKILHLTLYRQYFDEIASGKKTWEYRAVTLYWMRRLHGHEFNEVHFRNGYGKDRPFMRVECLGILRGESRLESRYEIKLGKILETRNYSPHPV